MAGSELNDSRSNTYLIDLWWCYLLEPWGDRCGTVFHGILGFGENFYIMVSQGEWLMVKKMDGVCVWRIIMGSVGDNL